MLTAAVCAVMLATVKGHENDIGSDGEAHECCCLVYLFACRLLCLQRLQKAEIATLKAELDQLRSLAVQR